MHNYLFSVNCELCSAEYSSHRKSKKKSSHESDSDSDSSHRRKRSRSRSRDKKKNSGTLGQPVTALLLEERLKKKEDRRLTMLQSLINNYCTLDVVDD